MPFLLIRHRVTDFARWKTAYDGHAGARKAAGLEDLHLLREAADPNMVVLLFRANDPAAAVAFTRSPDLREVMQKAGVEGVPEIRVLNEG